MGVVICVDGDYYIVPFKPMNPVVVTQSASVVFTLDDVVISPWNGPEKSDLIPLWGMRDVKNPLRDDPRPPKFESAEEAEEWLKQHPALLDTGDDRS